MREGNERHAPFEEEGRLVWSAVAMFVAMVAVLGIAAWIVFNLG